MKRPLPMALAIALLPGLANACVETAGLDGVLSIAQCDRQAAGSDCISGQQAAHEALNALKITNVFTIGAQTSPWRMYNADGRIMTMQELASDVRAALREDHRRIYLAGSWTATRPDGSRETLAHRLSLALEGFPVDGSDGFLWLSPKGETRTTHQAFSVWSTGTYHVARGDDVLMALVPGSLAEFEDMFADEGNSLGVLHAGIGHDVFMLCPEGALRAFERAANLGNPIGAYNAALMHSEAGNRTAAIQWMEQAAVMGDAVASAALAALRDEPRPR